MVLTFKHFLIVCPLVFMAGLVDAIGGGGGLISLPAYLIAGLPTHLAIGTNKLSALAGASVATSQFFKNKLINLKIGIPSVIAAVLGSILGANLALITDEKVMQYFLVAILPFVAIVVLNKKVFKESEEELIVNKRLIAVAILAAFIIGAYDGFYGPGSGTFLIIAFTVFGRISVKYANGQSKLINLTTDITSFIVYVLNGEVLIPLGVAAMIADMAGAYIGSNLVMKEGTKITRPVIIVVLILLLLKVLGVY